MSWFNKKSLKFFFLLLLQFYAILSIKCHEQICIDLLERVSVDTIRSIVFFLLFCKNRNRINKQPTRQQPWQRNQISKSIGFKYSNNIFITFVILYRLQSIDDFFCYRNPYRFKRKPKFKCHNLCLCLQNLKTTTHKYRYKYIDKAAACVCVCSNNLTAIQPYMYPF